MPRHHHLLAALFAAALAAGPAAAEPAPGALHHKDWFAVTFKDMREDLGTAAEQGKRLAILVEQHGCIYCTKLHEEVLSDPEVADFIKQHFVVVQLNMFGAEEVTDLDGTVMTEREAIRRWAISFTPTVIFLPEEAPEAATVRDAAVEIMPGAFGKWTVLDMFRWVHLKGYEGEEHFQKFHARTIEQLRGEGRL